jgi:hypothetical protein
MRTSVVSLDSDFTDHLSPGERKLHEHLMRTNLEYQLAAKSITSLPSRMLMRALLTTACQQGGTINTEPVDLDLIADRAKIYATPPGRYIDVEIKPPPELFQFLQGEDAGRLTAEKIERISDSVLDWLNRRYQPPRHLAFRLDYSDILAGEGHPAPLEIWLSSI